MDRRTFLSWVGLGAIASSLPIAIAACTPQAEDETTAEAEPRLDPTPREDGFMAIGTVAELKEKGFVQDMQSPMSPAIAIADPSGSGIIAMNSMCTHQGCSVEWNADDQLLKCPCHGSQFNPDGTVAQGPAAAPLERYEAKIEDDLVLVKSST